MKRDQCTLSTVNDSNGEVHVNTPWTVNETFRVLVAPEAFFRLSFFLFTAGTDFDNSVSSPLVDDRPC